METKRLFLTLDKPDMHVRLKMKVASYESLLMVKAEQADDDTDVHETDDVL